MADLQRIGRALSGLGAGIGGRGAEFGRSMAMERKEDRQEQRTLTLERRKAMATDVLEVSRRLGEGNKIGAQELLFERIGAIEKLGGDPSQSIAAFNAVDSINSNESLEMVLSKFNDDIQDFQAQGLYGDGSADRSKFIGTPQRVSREATDPSTGERTTKNFLSGVVQNADGTFTRQDVAVDGNFLSTLGETAEQQSTREVKQAGDIVTAQGGAEAATPLGAASLASKRLAIDESTIKNEQERLDLIGAKEASIAESTSAAATVDGLLRGDRFSAGFGKLVTSTPQNLRSQNAIDVIAELDQIRALVSLGSREKLRGQGTITDSEAKTLEQSATLLSNPLISEKLARKELKKIKGIFDKSTSRNRLSKSTREQRLVRRSEPSAAGADVTALSDEDLFK